MRPGDTVDLPGMRAHIDQVNAQGFPVQVSLDFDHPLESDRFVWMAWDSHEEKYAPFQLPRIGEDILLPGMLQHSPDVKGILEEFMLFYHHGFM